MPPLQMSELPVLRNGGVSNMHGTIELPNATPVVLGDNPRVQRQVRDALALSEFAVQSGFKASDGTLIPPEIISHIETASVKLGFLQEVGYSQIGNTNASNPVRDSIAAAEWVEFELAYYKLSTLLSPITAQSLNDTERDTGGSRTSFFSGDYWRQKLLGSSPANRFTRGIWLVAICFVAFVVVADWFVGESLKDGNLANHPWSKLLQAMILYAYGGLGACAYLLRSAHTFIYKRTYDFRREPEYYNRILLGTIAGGTITLFVNQTTGDEIATVQLSSAALSFIAGYSTDFLFSKIESIISVILPKEKDDRAKPSDGSRSASKHIMAQTNGSLSESAERHDEVDRNKEPPAARVGSNGRHRKPATEADRRVGR
jgi:hypothetical protein